MDVFVSGKGKVTLSDSKDFIAEGGQGRVYAKGGLVYKIYLDPSKMVPQWKVKELSVLDDPKIIRPQSLLLDKANHPIGYTMRHVEHAHALCEMFPKAFKDRHKLTQDALLKLVRQMQETISFVHSHKILLVDLNEMNFMVDNKFTDVYFIDVDSYQTPSFPCTAQMTSIVDHHTRGFTALSDWFSFGVVSFNLFVGIHPFKGRHPDFKWPIDEDTLIRRMKRNASVFDPKVSLPGVCLPLTSIPQSYRDWYKAIFADGKRLPPPTELVPAVVIVVPQVKRITGTDNFDISEIMSLPDPIVFHANFGGTTVTLTSGAAYSGTRRLCKIPANVQVAIAPKTRYIVTARINQGRLELHNASNDSPILCDIAAEQVMGYEGRLYTKKGASIYEVEFIENGIALLPTATCVANAHERATRFFDGVAVQPMFGKWFVTIFPKMGESRDIKIDEIQGQIVAAKFDNNVLMVVAVKGGNYSRHVFRFDKNYGYDVKTVENIAYTGLNFVTLDNGICANMNEADEIELFRNLRDDPMVKVVPDDQIGSDMRLFKNSAQVIFAKGAGLYTIKMKSKP